MKYNTRFVFWAIAIIFGLLQTYAYRQSMNSDGVCYLDMAEYAAKGDLKQLVNGHWSPLYPTIITAAVAVFQPSPEWKFPLVQSVNFLCLLFAIFALELFVKQLTKSVDDALRSTFHVIVYLLFLWGTFKMITVRTTSPDLLMSGFVYLATAQILRLKRGSAKTKHALLLGLVLGLGYLAKAVMFPLSFVFIAVAFFVVGDSKARFKVVSIALLMFLMVASPYIYALSSSMGKLTYSEVWKVAYTAMVNGERWGFHEGSRLNNTVARVSDDISVYSFGLNPTGTYPIMYDSSFWTHGNEIRYSFKNQLKRLFKSLMFYYNVFFNTYIVFSVCLLLLILMSVEIRGFFRGVLSQWDVMFVPAFAMAMYSFVYIEKRMVGVFITIMLVSLFYSIGVPFLNKNRSVVLVMAVITMLKLFVFTVNDYVVGSGKSSAQSELSGSLISAGVREGSSIGTVGLPRSTDWAKQAGVNILAFTLERDSFTMAEEDVRMRTLNAFKNKGCNYVIAEHFGRINGAEGWEQLGETEYYIIDLSKLGDSLK